MSELQYHADKIWDILNRETNIYLQDEQVQRALFDILLVKETFGICKNCDRVCFKEDMDNRLCWRCDEDEYKRIQKLNAFKEENEKE